MSKDQERIDINTAVIERLLSEPDSFEVVTYEKGVTFFDNGYESWATDKEEVTVQPNITITVMAGHELHRVTSIKVELEDDYQRVVWEGRPLTQKGEVSKRGRATYLYGVTVPHRDDTDPVEGPERELGALLLKAGKTAHAMKAVGATA